MLNATCSDFLVSSSHSCWLRAVIHAVWIMHQQLKATVMNHACVESDMTLYSYAQRSVTAKALCRQRSKVWTKVNMQSS